MNNPQFVKRKRRRYFTRLLRRNIERLLDRPGGRHILEILATYLARLQTSDDANVFYKDMWIYRVGSFYLPVGRQFVYISDLKTRAEFYIAQARDYWYQYYQPQKGDVVVDIGAGRGEDTWAFSRSVGDSGRVIAIEAHPLTFEILKSFCTLNRLENTLPLQVAVMDRTSIVSMVESKAWEVNTVAQPDNPQGIKVRATTLDDICEAEAVDEINFLKMNIEGAERYALLGMKSVIHRVQFICVACHDFMADAGHGEHLRTYSFVKKYLAEHGFKVASRTNDPRKYIRDHVYGFR